MENTTFIPGGEIFSLGLPFFKSALKKVSPRQVSYVHQALLTQVASYSPHPPAPSPTGGRRGARVLIKAPRP